MSDVKLVISLDENKYRQITTMPNVYGSEICEAIRNGTPCNPTGDCISREALSNVILNDRKLDGVNANWEVNRILAHIYNAPTVEPEITEKQAILLLINSGWLVNHDKELRERWERPQGENKPLNWLDRCDDDYLSEN